MKRENKKQRKNQKGFTLVEMIVVIAIIGVLATMMVPSLLGFVDKAHESNMNAAAAGLGRGIEAILLEGKWSGLTGDMVYTGTVGTNKKVTFTHTGGSDTFKDELGKIVGEGYEAESKIFVVLNANKLKTVVYGKKLSGASDATSKSSKDIGIYPNK